VARTKYSASEESLWIGAVCIDQNDVSERNQQVAQMGLIYSSAVTVLAWLGRSEGIAQFLASMKELVADVPRGMNVQAALSHLYGQGRQELQAHWVLLRGSTYWTRAWISQEVFLARPNRMLAEEIEVGTAELQAVAILLPTLENMKSKYMFQNHPDRTTRMTGIYVQVMAKQSSRSFERNMLDLSRILRGRDCHIPRDRIYSLRSIAHDGGRITVSYGTTDAECLLQAIDDLHMPMCFCSLKKMAILLGCPRTNSCQLTLELTTHYTVPLAEACKPRSRDEPAPKSLIQLGTREQAGRLRPHHCSTCKLPDTFLAENQYIFCLREHCTNKSKGTHMILHTNSSTLFFRTATYQYAREPDQFDVVDSRSRIGQTTEERTAAFKISMDLRSWIDMVFRETSYIREPCQSARQATSAGPISIALRTAPQGHHGV
jgi:hypothetical protein